MRGALGIIIIFLNSLMGGDLSWFVFYVNVVLVAGTLFIFRYNI